MAIPRMVWNQTPYQHNDGPSRTAKKKGQTLPLLSFGNRVSTRKKQVASTQVAHNSLSVARNCRPLAYQVGAHSQDQSVFDSVSAAAPYFG